MAENYQGHLAPEFARRFAQDWIAAWNGQDLERVLALYAEDFEMASPRIVALAGEASGVLKGKAKVAAYWAAAIKATPPSFTLLDVYAGIDRLAIHYRGRHEAVEMLEFNADGLIARASANWKV